MTGWGSAAKRAMPAIPGVPINVPRLPTGMIVRPRLLHLLDGGAPFTLVHGPAGFGKTTLAVQWVEKYAAASVGRVVWVSLQDRIQSTATLWKVLAAELQLAGFQVPDGDPSQSVRSALRAVQEPVVLVVDGFELDVAEVQERPLFDLARSNRNLRVIICLRQDPPFLKTPTTDVDICRIRPEDLQFTRAESEELLALLAPQSAAVARGDVHEQLGGWPLLVRAAGLDNLDLTRVNTLLQTERPKPFDSPEVVAFLFRTVILERFSLAQARVLSEDRAVQQRITDLLDVGVLREDPDDLFSYVPAVRRSVLSRADSEDASQMQAAYVRMAQWKIAQRHPVDAMHYAAAGRAWDLLVQIIEQNWNETLSSARAPEILAELPAEALESQASLRIFRDVLTSQPSLGTGTFPDISESEHWQGGAEPPAVNRQLIRGAAGSGAAQPLARFLDARAGQAVLLRFQGNTSASGRLVESMHQAVAAATAHEIDTVIRFLPALYLQWGLTELFNDDALTAASSLHRAYELASQQNLRMLMRNSAGALALIFALNGDSLNCEEWLAREGEVEMQKSAAVGPAASCGPLARALRFVDRWELDEARGALAKCPEPTGRDEFWAFAAYVRALLGLAEGFAREELQQLTAAKIAHPSRSGPGSIADVLIRSVTADLLMAQSKASHAAAQLRDGPRGHELLKAPRARLELLRSNPAAALRELAGGSNNDGFGRTYGEQRLLSAVAQLRLGHSSAASAIFAMFVEYSDVSGVRFPFRLLDSADLRALWEGAGVQADWLEQFADAAPVFPAYASVVTLSEREHIVLAHLAEGMSLQQIADFLVVSPNTVKSQTRSVYRKLGVSSRDEAVTMAHELGMLTTAQ